jgi:diguanylate cyclase (GGDEF)-like protein
MPNRLLRHFGRKQPEESSSGAASPGARSPQGGSASPQALAALELARELLRGIEHFVLSTPDLDAPGFMDRLRRTAAQLTGMAQPPELEGHRVWAADALSAFGQLQRRYLSEREDELWRLLTLYQDHQKTEGAANTRFQEGLRGVHDRLKSAVRLDDLRQVRERLETELQRATTLVEQKSQADEERAAVLAAQVRQLEAALTRARYEAMQDALTGIYHRGGFEAQLEAILQSPTRCTLAIVDVDNFKGINDTLGHLVGDQILKIAVELLGSVGRAGDVLGRFGGDEFCLMSPGAAPERLAERFNSVAAQRLINFHHEERLCSVRLSFSVGVAGSVPGDTVQSLIQRADAALYEVKRSGKGQVRTAPTPAPAPASA